MLLIRPAPDSPLVTFPELGEGVEVPGLFSRSIDDREIRFKFNKLLLKYSKKVRSSILARDVEKVAERRAELLPFQKWVRDAKPYKTFLQLQELDQQKFVEGQLALFEKQYDASTQIAENWKWRFPGIVLARRGNTKSKK